MNTPNLGLLLDTYAHLVNDEYENALIAFIQNEGVGYKTPTIDLNDAHLEDAIQHVQESSEHYYQMSKLAGFARSAHKIAESRYKQKFRNGLLSATGSNKEAREAEAAQAASEEYDLMVFYESAVTLFSSLEQAARVNADSSRKIADLIHSQRITEAGNSY